MISTHLIKTIALSDWYKLDSIDYCALLIGSTSVETLMRVVAAVTRSKRSQTPSSSTIKLCYLRSLMGVWRDGVADLRNSQNAYK